MEVAYVLSLMNDKYYIGYSNMKCLNYKVDSHYDHTRGQGLWLDKFKPRRLIEIIECNSIYELNNIVKKKMKLFGINNVRGGTYNSYILDENVIKNILDEFYIEDNICPECGSECHYENSTLCKYSMLAGDDEIYYGDCLFTCPMM